MRRRPPRSTLTDTLFPYTTLFRSVPAYPSVASLRAMAPGGHEADIFDFRIQPRFSDAKAFLGHLRGLGAHVPKGGAAPLSPGALRRVMRVFEDSGAAATYHVAVCTFRSEEHPPEPPSLMRTTY